MVLRFMRWTVSVALLIPSSHAFCPAGFDPSSAASFPEEWKIPKWPQDMTMETAAGLKTVSLGGFLIADLNEEYLEGPTKEFNMQGEPTYWQASGQYFMYYCQRFEKWRIAALSGFSKNMDGGCLAFVSDAHKKRDIRNESHIKGWIEVEAGQWIHRPDAGVVSVGRLGDQMELGEDDELEEGAEGCDNDTDDGNPFGKKDKSNCPVMPHVRKARDKVVETVKAAGKWAQRLFPKYLGTPDEQDAVPEDDKSNPLFSREAGEEVEGGCDPNTMKGCSFKEQYYIEKQRNRTDDERSTELQRLRGYQDVVMKPDKKAWVDARAGLLVKMGALVDDRSEL